MIKRRVGLCFAVLVLFLTAGCYDSKPLKDSILVMGTGVDKVEGKEGYRVSFEILKVGAGQETAAGGAEGVITEKKSIVLEIEADTMFEAVRRMIQHTKRRLFFNHNRIWVISERVAKDNILKPFDPLLRDQMLRLNSFLFITPNEPEKILATPSLLESVTSMEISSSMNAIRYLGGNLGGQDMIELLENLSGPMQASFTPVIGIKQQTESKITVLKGLAIIKKDKMVGWLPEEESVGLMLLRGGVRGGVLKTKDLDLEDQIQIELLKEDTKIKTKLKDGSLTADLVIRLKGTIAVAPPEFDLSKPGVKQQVDRAVESWAEELAHKVLKKLQKEYRTDVTNIGLQAYRKYPHEWQKIKDEWEDVFANAKINVKVKADIYHPGLTFKSKGSIRRKPEKNPYTFMFTR